MAKGYTHRITPIKPDTLIKIFEKLGFVQYPPSGDGSHIPMKRNQNDIPIVIVKHGHREIKPNAIKGLLKTANISQEQYLDIYNQF